jgi:hypothetical protein
MNGRQGWRITAVAACFSAPLGAHAQIGNHCREIGNIIVRALCFDDAYRNSPPAEAPSSPSGAPEVAVSPLARPELLNLYPGPPMTGAEKDAFRNALQGCWVVDPGAQAAGVAVTVVFELDREGQLVSGPDLLTSSGGSPSAVEAAFQSAMRAIERCARNGFPLPPEKYDQWRVVEMTFDASGMRVR